MLALPRTSTTPRRYVYGKTPDEAVKKYLAATGQGVARIRPGSISEFVVTIFTPYKEKHVQSDTLRRYDNLWQYHVGKTLGHYLFSELTPEIVQAAITSPEAGATQQMAKGFLKQIVEVAIAHGWATPREAAMVSTVKHKPRKAKERRDVAQRAETLLQSIERAGHWTEGPVWAAITLGLRKAEICGLRVTDLGADNVLTLRHQRDHRTGDRARLKHREEGETRRIALPAELADRLRGYASTGSIYLFTDDQGRPISYQHLADHIRPFQPAERLTIHDLRSAAINRLVDLGVKDRTIMELVGHQSVEMIQRYRDKRDERVREALSRTPSRTTSGDNPSG